MKYTTIHPNISMKCTQKSKEAPPNFPPTPRITQITKYQLSVRITHSNLNLTYMFNPNYPHPTLIIPIYVNMIEISSSLPSRPATLPTLPIPNSPLFPLKPPSG